MKFNCPEILDTDHEDHRHTVIFYGCRVGEWVDGQ